MYRKEKSVAMKGSASALTNNLSVLVNVERQLLSYAVVHKSTVNLVTISTDGSTINHRQIACKELSATQATSMILQAKLVAMAGRTLLVFASQKGIQMFEADGSIMLYWYAIGDLAQSDNDGCFGRGICGVQEDTVCIGTHSGDIYVFHIPAKGTNITLSETLKGHKRAIFDVSSSGSRMGSCDEAGNIAVWHQCDDHFQQACFIAGSGIACTSLALWEDAVIAGYSSGHIRVYSSSAGRLTAEAAAHSRCVTSVDVASNGKVLSTSEDSYVRVWKLSAGVFPTLEFVWTEAVPDVQLQGGAFLDKAGRAFALTGYDSNSLYFFSAN